MAHSTRQAVATDRLDAMLTRLKLHGVRDQLDTLLGACPDYRSGEM